MDWRTRSPLDALGKMPTIPAGWETMAVVQPIGEPRRLERRERFPLVMYPVVTVREINTALGWYPLRGDV